MHDATRQPEGRTRRNANRMPAVLAALVLLTAARAADVPAQGETTPETTIGITGTVSRAVTGGAVRKGTVEIRWPAHDDAFEPVTTSLAPEGTYRLSVPRAALPERLDQLTVSVIAEGFSVSEKPLPVAELADDRPVTIDFELSAATLDGILDIFACCVLSWSVVTVMFPAFFLGAAIKTFVPSHKLLEYLGPQASQPVAYGAAVGSGMVLSLCSCNVVPLFLSIWRSGAGTGPAFAFLYAGPAINVVSMAFTCRVIGLGIGIWRVVAVALMSVVVGLAMSRIFGPGGQRPEAEDLESLETSPARNPAVALVSLLLVLLVLGSIEMKWGLRAWLTVPVTLAVVAVAVRWLEREHAKQWLRETGVLLLKITPILVPAVLLMAFFAQKVPLSATRWLTGSNALTTNGAASVVGALMYFPIMTEGAFVKTLLKVMGMATGPAMAVLLTAPGLSLPGMVIVSREIGMRKLTSYVLLLVLLATVVGWFFGSSWGSYLCNCEFK